MCLPSREILGSEVKALLLVTDIGLAVSATEVQLRRSGLPANAGCQVSMVVL